MEPQGLSTYRLMNKATGKFLTGRTDPDNYSVYTLGDGDFLKEYQRWTLDKLPDGFWHLTSQLHGLRLDSNAERSIYLHDANDGSYQKWILRPAGEDYWTLQNLATSFMVDSNVEGHAYTMDLNDGAYQRWRFQDPLW